MIDKNTNHPRGFGFITLEDASKVQEILLKQPHYINGKKIDCKIAIPKELLNSSTSSSTNITKKKDKKTKKKHKDDRNKNKSPSQNVSGSSTNKRSIPLYLRKMFVGGLPPMLTKEELVNYFSQFGQVEKGIIMTDKNTGRSRGFGFIIFTNKETVDKIMATSNCHFLYGKWIECKRAQPKEQIIRMLSDNNTCPIVNGNLTSNDNLVLNDILSDKPQSLFGDKFKSDMNLFMYQNYIPKKQIKYFLNSNINSNQAIEDNKESTTTSSSTNSSQLINYFSSNLLAQNNNSHTTFQNYFNNCMKSSAYNYFHYKLFDKNGGDLTTLSTNTKKNKMFTEEIEKSFENSKILPMNSKNLLNISSSDIELNSEDCFNSVGRKRKIRHENSSNESYKPY